MSSKIINTSGIVIRSVDYSESSIICDVYTEQLGVKSYIISGARGSKSKNNKSIFFQPSAMLDLVVYDNRLKDLNRIKEISWKYLYKQTFFSAHRSAVALFVVEMLHRTLRQPDYNPVLYAFVEETLIKTDTEEKKILANIPTYFMIQLLKHLGFQLSAEQLHLSRLREDMIDILNLFIQTSHINDLKTIDINKEIRYQLFVFLEDYYRRHIADFGKIKSYHIFKEIL